MIVAWSFVVASASIMGVRRVGAFGVRLVLCVLRRSLFIALIGTAVSWRLSWHSVDPLAAETSTLGSESEIERFLA